MSTFLISPIMSLFNGTSIWGTPTTWLAGFVSNLVGGCVFFWVDRFIFTSKAVEMWHVIKEGTCDNCGKVTELWRLTLAPGYDKRKDDPKYLCMECSKKKTDGLRAKGIKIRGKSQ
jgi:hypothetical protein